MDPIVIVAEKMEDGGFLLSSPNCDDNGMIFSAFARNEAEIVSIGLPIILETIRRNKPTQKEGRFTRPATPADLKRFERDVEG